MKLPKRITSLALSLSVVASLFTAVPITAGAAEAVYTPDKAILENILNGDRHFVIDTLVGDSGFHTDFSTNPHALVNYIGSENTMMDNVLSQYQNKDDPNYSATYKAAVDVMEKVYNSDEYAQTVADFVTEFGADLLSSFSTDAANFASDLTYSKSQLNYESILKEALASDYTASDGTELSTKEIELENLERLEKGLKCLKAFQAFALSYGKANNYDEKDENFKNKYDYFKTYLTSYSDSIEKALSSFEKVMKIDDVDEINTFLTLMGTVAQYDLYCEEIQAVGSDIPQYAATYFVSDDDLKKMKFDKSVISGVSNTLSSYMFINSIATQRDSISDTLTRMSQTANPSLKPILVDFASEVGNAGDAKLMGYQTLMKTLRDESAVVDFSKWSAKKITDKFAVMKKMKKEALDSALGKTISSATAVAGISSWCADTAASFGDTCKKTYELKYLRTLIAQTVTTYKSDISAYNSDKTEENAGKVIDDLLMLQKLRLRGEKIAYEMTQGQWNSPLGRLLASGTLSQDKMLMNYLDEAYQARVDAFIGASAMPFSTDSITVGSGEQLTIEYDSSCGGLVGRYTKADKTMYGIGELQYKIANGVTVNSGGTLLTISTSNNCKISFINNNGGTVLVSSNTQGITEFSQSGGTAVFGGENIFVPYLYLNGGTITTSQLNTIKCDILSSDYGATELKVPLQCNTLYAKGTITGNSVNLTGDSFGGDGFIQSLNLCGSKAQTLNNTINTENITYNNPKGVIQNGKVKISGNLKNKSTKIKNAKNTTLVDGGRIDDGYYKQDISIEGKISDNFVEYDSIVYVSGNASIGNAKINNMLYQTDGSLTISGDVEIVDTANCRGNVTQTVGEFILRGDASFAGSANLNNLFICGNKTQSISGTLTVNDYINENTAGLSIGGKINVKGKAKSIKAPTMGASNVTLINNSYFAENKYYGDVTIGNRSGSLPKLAKVYGNIYINGNITQTQADTILYAIDMNGGNLVIKDCTLNLKNRFTLNSGNITLQNANLICNAVFNPSSSVTIGENSRLEVYSDIVNKGTITGNGTVKVSGNITNSGTLNVNRLILTTESNREISGNDIFVKELQAIGKNSINLSATINVSESFNLDNVQIDTSKIKYTKGYLIDTDTTVDNDLFLKNAFTATNAAVKLNGSLSVENNNITLNGANVKTNKDITITGGNLSINENSELSCKGKLNISNGNITVSDNSTLIIRKNATLANVNISLGNNSKIVFYSKFNISGNSANKIMIDTTSALFSKGFISVDSIGKIITNGTLIIGSDATLKNTSITGTGITELYGDLSTTNTTDLTVDTFKIGGKFAEKIGGTGLKFNNLIINNNSSGGVNFDSATYKGELITGNSKVNGTITAEE